MESGWGFIGPPPDEPKPPPTRDDSGVGSAGEDKVEVEEYGRHDAGSAGVSIDPGAEAASDGPDDSDTSDEGAALDEPDGVFDESIDDITDEVSNDEPGAVDAGPTDDGVSADEPDTSADVGSDIEGDDSALDDYSDDDFVAAARLSRD